MTAIFNAICPNAPVSKVGRLTVLGTTYTVFKILLIYPIVTYLSEDSRFVIQQTKQPDLFRCWNQGFNDTRCNKIKYDTKNNDTVCSPRTCESNEMPNDILFHMCIPICIASLLLITIPSGFVISHIMRKNKLQNYEATLTNWLSPVQKGFTRCMEWISCCTSNKEDVVDGIEKPNAISESNIDDKSENDKDNTQTEATEEVLVNQTTMEEDIKVLPGIEKPNVILQNVRRLFSPPVKRKLVSIFLIWIIINRLSLNL